MLQNSNRLALMRKNAKARSFPHIFTVCFLIVLFVQTKSCVTKKNFHPSVRKELISDFFAALIVIFVRFGLHFGLLLFHYRINIKSPM